MSPAGLIGRGDELVELAERTRASRLVTVVGPGGVGKSALAAAVAMRVADGFPLGARHIDMTRVEDPRTVPGALAAQLGFDSFEGLLGSPVDQPVLLVVDGCEHLLDAAAEAVAALLSGCVQATVLATSRSPLELPGESILTLAPLPRPPPGDDPLSCPSVELFLQRCDQSGATVDEAGIATVADLCGRLDGLPLALEIAAARARTMSLADIAARLDESVDVLSRPRFRGDPRHRSVTDTIAWSHGLLSPDAADLLEQLAVFAGPFGADAARAVAATEDFDDGLDELVTASLLAVDTSGAETRYRLLDTVRRFALDRLEARGATHATYDRFVDHVVARARAQMEGASVAWRADLVSDVVATFDDVAESLRWTVAHDPDPRRAHRLAAALWVIVHQSRADDIVDLVRQVVARYPDPEARGAAHTVAVLATAEYVTGDPATASTLADGSLATHDHEDLAAVLLHRVLGQGRSALGDRTGAIEAFRRGTEIAQRLGMTAMALELEVARATVTADDGDVGAAIDLVESVVDRADGTESVLTVIWARTVHAWLSLRVDPETARAAADEAETAARNAGYPIAVAANMRTAAFGHLLLDDLSAATATLRRLLDELIARGALSNARVLIDSLAAVAHRAGHPACDRLTTTARGLPITTLVSGRFELVPLPATDAPALPRREVLGAARVVLDELASSNPPAAGASTSTAEPPTAEASVVVRGDVVELTFSGRSVTVRSSKGIVDIVRLLAAEGREVHCLELADAAVGQASTGAVIDATARRQYEERIRELQEEVEDAERDNDHGRAYRYQVELDTLIDHLTAALGRGGATRRAPDDAERARSAVTHRVRAAIRRLDKLHPTLGHHLAHAVETGTYCTYRPERPVAWLVHRPAADDESDGTPGEA